MRISVKDFSYVVDKIAQEAVGKRIRKLVFYSSRIFYLQISSGRKRFLAINLDNANPTSFISDLTSMSPTLINPLYIFLKKELNNALIKKVLQINNDRILCLELEITTSAYKTVIRHLYVELIAAHPNLILADEDDRILNAFRKNTIDAPRIVARDFKYTPPQNAPRAKKSDDVPFDYAKFIIYELSRLNQSSMTRNQEKFIKIYRFINTRIKTASRKIDNIKADVAKAREQLINKDYGDAILSLTIDKKWHTDKIEVEGAIIPLNNQRTLAENAQAFYRIYKKAKNTIAISDKLIETAEKELNESLFIKDFLSSSTEEEIERFVAQNALMTAKDKIRLPITKKYAPYHLESGGTTFYFGKTADQNDYLSFVYASRQHIWFHLLNQPGAHIIIKKPAPSTEDLIVAAEIALLCSKLDRGEVMYAAKKDISRGDAKGEARVKKCETVYVSFVRPSTADLFNIATRLEVK
ncbi:MAG: NFACT family protein [Bacilli bacterium]|jgi:predicted ribosome quality control (RQC) complex YloA/Tae2 family protein